MKSKGTSYSASISGSLDGMSVASEVIEARQKLIGVENSYWQSWMCLVRAYEDFYQLTCGMVASDQNWSKSSHKAAF